MKQSFLYGLLTNSKRNSTHFGALSQTKHTHMQLTYKYLRSHKYAQTINCLLKIRKSNRKRQPHTQSSSSGNKISLNNEYSRKKNIFTFNKLYFYDTHPFYFCFIRLMDAYEASVIVCFKKYVYVLNYQTMWHGARKQMPQQHV